MTGRHRNAGRIPLAAQIIILGTVVVLAVVGGVVTYRVLRPSCAEEIPLLVAAAPEIAPAVRTSASAWAKSVSGPHGECISLVVTAAASPDVAAAVAKADNLTLPGVGEASGSVTVPDIWIPDSSLWLQRIRAAQATAAKAGQSVTEVVPQDAGSLARSPVVLAMPEPVAKGFGWPDAKLTWPALLQKLTTTAQVHVGIVDPTRDSAGLSGLLALSSAAAASDRADEATVAALRALVSGRSVITEDLLARFPRQAEPTAIASALSVAPLSEQAVITYNRSQPPVRLAALYLQPAPLGLDYPYAPLPGLDADRAALATALGEALDAGAHDFARHLAGQGLRDANGTMAATGDSSNPAVTPAGAPATLSASPMPANAAVITVLSTWNAITRPSRMLAIIDVSGSMLARVPGTGGITREQLTVDAARVGLSLFDDNWTVGLWTFSTLLDGANDYRELMPIGPLSAQRAQALAALDTVVPKPGGATGLYDTTLAAYRTVQNGWDAGRVNSIVLLTDGKNEDKNGISLETLTSTLEQEADPQRPIQMIIIGIGTEVSKPDLEKITAVTGGGVFIATDPTDIKEIFLQAIALRAG